jgi:hypothetical protein
VGRASGTAVYPSFDDSAVLRTSQYDVYGSENVSRRQLLRNDVLRGRGLDDLSVMQDGRFPGRGPQTCLQTCLADKPYYQERGPIMSVSHFLAEMLAGTVLCDAGEAAAIGFVLFLVVREARR